MTQFQRWVPAAYMNSIAYLRRPVGRRSAVLPWGVAVVASVALAALLVAHVVPSRVVSAQSAPVEPGESTSAPAGADRQLEKRIDRLTEIVDRMSTRLDESSRAAGGIDALQRELAGLSKTTEALKRELAGVSKHAMQVESSISNIDVNVNTPEVLSNKLERQKKSLTRP